MEQSAECKQIRVVEESPLTSKTISGRESEGGWQVHEQFAMSSICPKFHSDNCGRQIAGVSSRLLQRFSWQVGLGDRLDDICSDTRRSEEQVERTTG